MFAQEGGQKTSVGRMAFKMERNSGRWAGKSDRLTVYKESVFKAQILFPVWPVLRSDGIFGLRIFSWCTPTPSPIK